MGLLGSIFGRKKSQTQAASVQASLPAPQQPIFVIGDLHGRADLLERILEQIDHEIGSHQLKNPRLVFVGNIIDFGPSSAAVITRMRELTQEFPENVVCLMGNHEQMCLDFLEAPVARHARWLKGGAAQTFGSYGVKLGDAAINSETAADAAVALRSAMGDEVIDWIKSRPSIVSSGSLHVVHAAADPRRALDDQSTRVLTWGHPEFLTIARGDGQWVAHGHTVFERPYIKDSRISVDTGAWETGTLSAAMILPDGQVGFVQAEG